MSIRDPEQLRADIERWGREIRTWRAQGLTDDHPNIQRRLNRIAVAQHLLDAKPTGWPDDSDLQETYPGSGIYE